MLTRYEFGDTGIFHSLQLLDGINMEITDKEEFKEADNNFEKNLPCPPPLLFSESNQLRTKSYFTEKGVKRFQKDIDTYIYLFEKYLVPSGIGEISISKIPNAKKKDIVYQDEYQTVIRIL